jgi:hypothetical protein
MYLVMIVDYNAFSSHFFHPRAYLVSFLGLLVVYNFALPEIYLCPCLIHVLVFVRCVLLQGTQI